MKEHYCGKDDVVTKWMTQAYLGKRTPSALSSPQSRFLETYTWDLKDLKEGLARW